MKLKILVISFLILVIVMGFTLYNINQFMAKEEKCHSGFEVIERCKCIPDIHLANLFGYTNYKQSPMENFE